MSSPRAPRSPPRPGRCATRERAASWWLLRPGPHRAAGTYTRPWSTAGANHGSDRAGSKRRGHRAPSGRGRREGQPAGPPPRGMGAGRGPLLRGAQPAHLGQGGVRGHPAGPRPDHPGQGRLGRLPGLARPGGRQAGAPDREAEEPADEPDPSETPAGRLRGRVGRRRGLHRRGARPGSDRQDQAVRHQADDAGGGGPADGRAGPRLLPLHQRRHRRCGRRLPPQRRRCRTDRRQLVSFAGAGGGAEGLRPEPIRVVISDDHQLFRRGLKMVLEAEEDIEVVGEAAGGQEALARVEELAPDLVLMDVRMPRMGGIEATRAIRQLFPTTRIIVLTVSDEQDDLYGAVKAGANGYLLKEVSIGEVADAVRKVYAGESLLSAAL